MKWFSCVKALIFFFVFLIFIVTASVVCADENVVAQVGSVSVTKYELGREFQRILPLSGSYHGGVSKERVEEIKSEALDACIERALKVMYALDNELAADASLVKQQYDRVRDQFESEGAFRDALSGETPEAFRSSLFRQALAKAAEKIAVEDKVSVSEEDIRKFYNENLDKFITPIQYKASHILIKVDPAATKEQRQERYEFAKSLLAKARSGEDFFNLAYYNSDDRTKYVGGDLGYFSADRVVEEFAAAVKGLKIGEVSDLVETLYGYHIIKLADIKPTGQMSFEEVQSSIIPQMKKAHRDKIYSDWLTGLRAKYPVKKLLDVE